MKPLRLWIVAAAFTLPAWAAADSITEWNERTFACTVTAKQGPYPASRALAMVHVAMFDAANSIEHRYSAYKVQLSARPGSSAICCVLTICESSWFCVFTSTPPAATTSTVVV